MRGQFAAGVDLAGGTTEVVLERSVILGGPGPSFASWIPSPRSTGDYSSAIVSWPGPGPIIQCPGKSPASQTRPLLIRAFGSVFGRLHGVGVASVISSSSGADPPRNKSTGKGTTTSSRAGRASSPAATTPWSPIADLAEVRSTWNKADRESQEILLPWPYTADLASATPASIAPFVPSRETICSKWPSLARVCSRKPSANIASPAIPQPAGWALERHEPAAERLAAGNRDRSSACGRGVADPDSDRRLRPRARPTSPQTQDLTFDTAGPALERRPGGVLAGSTDRRAQARPSPRGGLGAPSIHARAAAGRVCVWRFASNPWPPSEPPSWSPEPNATGVGIDRAAARGPGHLQRRPAPPGRAASRST